MGRQGCARFENNNIAKFVAEKQICDLFKNRLLEVCDSFGGLTADRIDRI